jgi:hypothetical protein
MEVTEVLCTHPSIRLNSQIMTLQHSKRSREIDRADVPPRGNRRRSSRMALDAALLLSGEDRQKCSFAMPVKATNLNRHGAIVRLKRQLSVGSVVLVRNQRGAELPACVVTQLATLNGVSTYAIEFVDQDDRASNFWGISFPSNA